MKIYFEEPNMDVIRFAVEDTLTSSSFRTGGINSGFDEMEPDATDAFLCLMPPCA